MVGATGPAESNWSIPRGDYTVARGALADNHLPVGVGAIPRMFKAQLSDGEQIQCDDYEVEDNGVELYDDSGEFIAFVPYGHLLYVGRVGENDQMVW